MSDVVYEPDGVLELAAVAVPEREPVVMHVHRELRLAIMRGRLKAGERLVETQLSSQLTVSRTPVREAISKLESEGLVTRLANGGVVVAAFQQKVEEVFVIRQALECAAGRLACQNASDEELADILRGCREAMRETPDAETRSVVDRAFHLAIASASGSRRLKSLIEEFYEYSFAAMQIQPTEDQRRFLQVHHLEIASALVQRDADAVEEVVRRHFAEVHKITSRHLNQESSDA